MLGDLLCLGLERGRAVERITGEEGMGEGSGERVIEGVGVGKW